MQGIDIVAWWGAIVATVVLVWDVAKWWRSGPIVDSRVRLNMAYPDSAVVKEESHEDGVSKELATYCHIELANRGALPTTLMGVRASSAKRTRDWEISYEAPAFQSHFGKILPHVLSPGEVWSCRFRMGCLEQLAQEGKPYIEIQVSHRNKPIRLWPRLPANKRLQPTAERGG